MTVISHPEIWDFFNAVLHVVGIKFVVACSQLRGATLSAMAIYTFWLNLSHLGMNCKWNPKLQLFVVSDPSHLWCIIMDTSHKGWEDPNN